MTPPPPATAAASATAPPAGGHEHELSFLRKYIFSTDHKIIGIQFLITVFFTLMLGGLLALGIRWQLAYPWSEVPIFGKLLFAKQGGIMPPEFYIMLVTMHASVMIFLVIIPALTGAFGNFVLPLQIGARDMAFPRMNLFSYWFMWPAIAFFLSSFFVEGGAASAGWTSYPPLADVAAAAPGSHLGPSVWLAGMLGSGMSSRLGSMT
ncbi:MAG: cbb3-type cytochrome c oxidase subunit I, partial [Planctomycetota bacterium]